MKKYRIFKVMEGRTTSLGIDEEKSVYNKVVARYSSIKEAREMYNLLCREGYHDAPLALVLDFGLMTKRQQLTGALCGFCGGGGVLYKDDFTDVQPFLILGEYSPERGEFEANVDSNCKSVRVSFGGHEKEYTDIDKGIRCFLRHAFAHEECALALHTFFSREGKEFDKYRVLASTEMLMSQDSYVEAKRITRFHTFIDKTNLTPEDEGPEIEMVEI